MRSLGLQASQDDLQEMMTEADEDGSGKIIRVFGQKFKNVDEFRKYWVWRVSQYDAEENEGKWKFHGWCKSCFQSFRPKRRWVNFSFYWILHFIDSVFAPITIDWTLIKVSLECSIDRRFSSFCKKKKLETNFPFEGTFRVRSFGPWCPHSERCSVKRR